MFELPNGTPVTEPINLDEGTLQSFAHGVISTFIGRRKTPVGHRLVRAGRIVGYLAESEEKNVLLGGAEAKTALEAAETGQKVRHLASSYTMAGLGGLADVVPEAFVHQVDRQGLKSGTNEIERLLARDLSTVIRTITEDTTVRGAMAIDSGMLIDHAGDLPGLGDEERLASELHELMSSMKGEKMHEGWGMKGQSHWTLHTDNGALLLAQSGEISLAVWTEKGANHARLLSAASISLEGDIVAAGAHGAKLPEGFALREGRGGADAVVSFLKAGVDENVTGHIQSGSGNKAASLILSKGVPVALWAPSCDNEQEAMLALTEGKRKVKLLRFPAGTIVSAKSGTVEGFTISGFIQSLSTVRTRSEARQASLKALLDDLLGFEAGLEALRHARSKMKFKSDGADVAEPLPVMRDEAVAAVDAGLRRKLNKAERAIDELNNEKAVLNAQIKALEKKREAAQVVAREAAESRKENTTALEDANAQLNTMQVDLAQARGQWEEAESRAERLVRRVNELEHQVSERAAELAKAIGEAESSAELQTMIEELALKEAELQANLAEGSERLSTIRKQSEDEERRLRVLSEQVNTSRERHARAQEDLIAVQEQVNVSNLELESARSEEKHARRRTEEDRLRRAEDEARRTNTQAELRELMEERRQILRELGDLGARRGHAEAELASLVDKATSLAEAHEEALSDIQEAERLRARLAEEPLAQALLDDNNTFQGLGPVLERLEHARSLGYSVTMLDRAVERALQVIQGTVDHVAATPRHLLSSEVMTLLERQVPQTAGAVRGLARWSVQQRLEQQLGETVNHVVVDLEHLLEDFDRSITMLRRIRNVLEQVERLGAPSHEVHALLANCQRPEALPSLALGTRKLIQVALDDIYLEADQRDAGEAIGLEETARVLEELITQLDASGLTDGRPRGMMWDFQRDGLLPFERESIPKQQRIPVDETMLSDMEPHLVQGDIAEPIVTTTVEDTDEEGWSPLPPPAEELETPVSADPAGITADSLTALEDERAQLEAELARLDAEHRHRLHHTTTPATTSTDSALADLESRLSDVEF
ncbi:MAG TPA: hypothetical protein D7I13_02685 [Candidatus Poseidoniales archaeon]|nr:MAG TPA: hypothetical protein D7I13_02685 [Candidatus Poseidoniales archaeon]|tara:strand:- start:3021 stop:6203 length:3183 start_codon:yes stop_codon:yes gene_type:complete